MNRQKRPKKLDRLQTIIKIEQTGTINSKTNWKNDSGILKINEKDCAELFDSCFSSIGVEIQESVKSLCRDCLV